MATGPWACRRARLRATHQEAIPLLEESAMMGPALARIFEEVGLPPA